MPSLRKDILMMLGEGAIRLLTFRSLFTLGWLSNYPTYYRAIGRLEREGLLRKTKRSRDAYLRITSQGRQFLERSRSRRRETPPPWDRRWRLVIFDIPEKQRDLRRRLRRHLAAWGFGRVQRSVWISPHDYQDQILDVARRAGLTPCVFHLTVEKFSVPDNRRLAEAFWDIRGLQDRYRSLMRTYARKMAPPPAKGHTAAMLHRRSLRNLEWDYLAILSRDPQLPEDLLPANWAGAAARRFVERCRGRLSRTLPYDARGRTLRVRSDTLCPIR